MTGTINLPTQLVLNFLLIFTRVSSILFLAPIFNSRVIPSLLKVGLAFLISIIIFPFVQKINFRIDQLNPLYYFLMILFEMGIGMVIGFLATFIFVAVQTGGQIIGFSIGLSVANILDPITNQSVSELSILQNLFALLIFLAINGHHIFLKAIIYSFHHIPLMGFYFKKNVLEFIVKSGADIFYIAFKISAPMIIGLLVVDIVFSIMARLAPQINIMIVGLPVKIFVGFFILMMSIPLFAYIFTGIFDSFFQKIFLLLKTF